MSRKKHHSVYVVGLSRTVLKDRRFVRKNPDHDPDKPCLYVGMTGLSPEERLENHKAGHKSNRYVREYGLELRRELYEQYNPMTYDEARAMEVDLAEKLRTEGYAVWQK